MIIRQQQDTTIDIPFSDGTLFLGSEHKTRTFNVDVAFDSLNETQFREWKKFCNNKDLCDLIFDEEPYKVYTAKIANIP